MTGASLATLRQGSNIASGHGTEATAMDSCATVVPAAYAAGNHDLGPNGNTEARDSLFADYISLADYRQRPGFGGVYDREPDRTENSYHLFDGGGRQWLILVLEFAPRDDVCDGRTTS